MELRKGIYFLQVEKKGIVDSSSLVVIRDEQGLICLEVGGGGEENINQTLALFEQEGLDVSEVHTAIISHTHADHMGAIGYFRDRIPGLTVVDHEVDAPYMKDNTLLLRAFDCDLVAEHFPGERFDILEFYAALCPISETQPDRIVLEGDTLTCGAYTFDVIHTPGHHPGHISLYEPKEKILFVGDMVGMEVPFYTPSSGGAEGYLASMEKYLALDVELIIPSHGDLIENTREVIEDAAGKVRRREERLLKGLDGPPKTFTDLLPDLFRSPAQFMFPGAAVLASHLKKLKNDGVVQEEDGKYRLSGS